METAPNSYIIDRKELYMSYIYVITNDINNKQYVGKTNNTIENRFQEHLKDSKRRKNEKRPLYNAINKYGIEHFSIEQLEECSPEEASVKEIYWIGKLDTYKNGYNATLGGDSRTLYDYKAIVDKYKELQNQTLTAKFFHCDTDTVKIACETYNIPIFSSSEIMRQKAGKQIRLIEKDLIFETLRDAARFLQEENITTNKSLQSITKNITNVCKGERKTAYKFHWEYVN